MSAKMNTRTKIIKTAAFILINSFISLNIACAGNVDLNISKQNDCLSPAVQLNSQLMVKDFQQISLILEQELAIVNKSVLNKNIFNKKAKKKDIVNSIESNIASGLALSLKVNKTPTNLDKWFDGTSDEIATRFINAFDFGDNDIAVRITQVGLAQYFSGLDQNSKNIIKLKLEQLLRNAKRSVDQEALEDLRLVVLLGQDKTDPFAQRKIMGYTADNTIYLHLNTLILTETESDKQALGMMLKYQAGIVNGNNIINNDEQAKVEKLLHKKQPISASQRIEEAEQLKKQTIAKYSNYDWMSYLRLPGDIQDYMYAFTEKSRRLKKDFRDTIFYPWVSYLSWMDPSNWSIPDFLKPFAILNPMLLWGMQAKQIKKAIDWLQQVEKEDTDWELEFKVVKEKAHSYRLLEFSRDGFPIDEKALPVLIVNPNAGHDSTVGKDMVRTFLSKGHRVFAFDWQSATPDQIEMVSDLIANVTDCINFIPGKIQVAALCQGGWVSASAEALLASFNPDKVAAAYMAGVPFYTTLGENAITETIKNLPEWFYSMMVFYIGEKAVQDGVNQLGGFENMGDSYYKQIGYLLELVRNIDNPQALQRTRPFVLWFFVKTLQISRWYLEAVAAHFTGNDIYQGRYRTQVGHEMRTVDWSKLRVPVVLLSGTKDDVTAPGTVLKKDIEVLVETYKQTDIDININDVWSLLIEQGLISDSGEGDENRKKNEKAVLENKALRISLIDFLAIDNDMIKKNQMMMTAILYFLQEECYGQCRALREVVGTDPDQILEIIMNRGHMGVFSGSDTSESVIKWKQAIDWVNEKIADNSKSKIAQELKNTQADKNRIIGQLHRKIVEDAAFSLEKNLNMFNAMLLVEQGI